MTNAIILHGMPSKEQYFKRNLLSMSNLHWLPWLQSQLMKAGIKADTPEVPESYKPDWKTWVREVERFDINQETVLIGHSCGGGFWVRYLSERPELKVGRVVLVAPWIDPDGDETGSFFKFSIDPKLAKRTQGISIFHSDNDMGNIHKSVAVLRDTIEDVEYREFNKYGHFLKSDMKTEEFPELLDEIIST
jgi:uncharacterized protein